MAGTANIEVVLKMKLEPNKDPTAQVMKALMLTACRLVEVDEPPAHGPIVSPKNGKIGTFWLTMNVVNPKGKV